MLQNKLQVFVARFTEASAFTHQAATFAMDEHPVLRQLLSRSALLTFTQCYHGLKIVKKLRPTIPKIKTTTLKN